VVSRDRWVDSCLRRWKVALGVILTSSFLLVSNAWAALTPPSSSAPTAVQLQLLTMKTTTTGWATDARVANPAALFGGQLLHTVDGGRQWINVTPPHVTFNEQPGPTSLPHNTVTDFLSGSTAWTVTETSTSMNGTGIVLFSFTRDGGRRWHQWTIHLPHLVDKAGLFNPILNQADFLNVRDGWLAFGPDSNIFVQGMELWRTTNGGRSWTRIDQLDGISGRSPIAATVGTFTSADDGWMTEGANHRLRVLLHTTNGGRTWTKVALGAVPGGRPTFTGRFGVIRVLNAALTNNQILRTADGGHHWDGPFHIPGQFVLFRRNRFVLPPVVQQVSGLLIWDLDGNRLWRSTNGGATWNLQDTASALSRMGGIDFINRHVGWAQEKNRLWMTTSGGRHWTSWLPVLIR